MFVVILCSVLAFILTWLESKGETRGGMKLGFILITLLGVIHYDYGNDYMSYCNLYKQVTSYTFNLDAILAKEYFRDPGWVILCFLFKPIGGFFVMVAVLNIIQNIIVYRFIKANLEKRQWAFAVFIYLFVTSFYLMSFSMMRQMFAIIVFLGMWKYIARRKWWIPLVVLYLCSYVHGSALLLLPFAFWGFLPMKNATYIAGIYVVLLIILWLFGNTLNDIFQLVIIMDESFSKYAENYDESDTGLKLGLGFIINMIPFVLSVIFLFSKKCKYKPQAKSLVALAAISFLIIPFGQIVPIVSRVSSYFSIFSIVSIPMIYDNLGEKVVRKSLVTLYVLITMYSYYLFFSEGVYVKNYSTFHTIFSQL